MKSFDVLRTDGSGLATGRVVGQSTSNPFLPVVENAKPQPSAFEVAPTILPTFSPFAAPASTPNHAPPVVVDHAAVTDDTNDQAPSREELLKRAAELGPPRASWASIVSHPSDPVLGAKMQPRVAARRARFRKFVRIALGACAACCVIALGVTLVQPTNSHAAQTPTSRKTVPATAVVSVEGLEPRPTVKKSSPRSPNRATAAVRRAPKAKKRR